MGNNPNPHSTPKTETNINSNPNQKLELIQKPYSLLFVLLRVRIALLTLIVALTLT